VLIIFLFKTSQQGPGADGKNLMNLRHPSGHFRLHKVFFPVTHLGFGVWGTPGSRGWIGGVMLVLRTFHELLGRSLLNLVECPRYFNFCQGAELLIFAVFSLIFDA